MVRIGHIFSTATQTRFEKILSFSDGKLAFIANSSADATNDQKMVIGSLTKEGDQAWIEVIEMPESTTAHDLARNGRNAFVAAASIEDEGSLDGLVVEFNANGRVGSALRHGGNRSIQTLAISSIDRDAYAVAGVAEEPDSDNQDMWLLVRQNLLQSPVRSQESEQ